MANTIKIKALIKLKDALGYDLIHLLPIDYYVGGSSCLDFINNPNNINVIAVYKKNPLNAMNDRVAELVDKIDKSAGISLTLVDKDEPTLCDWLYSHAYINIFNLNKYRLNLLEEPNKIHNLVKEHYNKHKNNKKRLFEIMYYYFVVSNNNYELYPYQKRILSRWHDGEYDEELLSRVIIELNLEE